MADKKIVWGMSGVLLAFALVLGGCDANAGDDFLGGSNQKKITLLNLDSIPAPVRGASPVYSIPANDEYTGSISWQDTDGNGVYPSFGPEKVYKATVSLTPNPNYTFTGVGTFTHSGASGAIVQEPNGSGLRVTITFPATGETTQVNLLALDAYLTAPVIEATPDRTNIDSDQYTGTISWDLVVGYASIDKFQPGTAYKAELYLTAKAGYTFTGLAAAVFTYTGAASVTHTVSENGNTAAVTVIFHATDSPDAITNTNDIEAYLADWQSPVALKLELELSSTNWRAILSALKNANKTVLLDLSTCTASSATSNGGLAQNGTFDPDGTDTNTNRITGKGKIQSLILPDAATSIPDGESSAFYHFSHLQNVSGVNIVTIGNRAFSQCFMDYVPSVSLSFPAVENIGDYAFYMCQRLTSIDIPAVRTIGDYAFSGDSNNYVHLTSVSLPVVENIGDGAFSNCANLTSVSLPATAAIGGGVFFGSEAIFTVTGASSLSTSDGGKMLIQNGELIAYSLPPNNITLPNTFTRIGDTVFKNRYQIDSISAPEVLSIGNDAFYDCTSLETVNLPKAESIGNNAFSRCTSLETVSLPEATSIGNSAFSYCTSLATVNLPAATSIDNYAFNHTGTTALTVTLGATQPTLGVNIFDYVDATKNVTVKVPEASLETYRSDYDNSISNTNNWGNAFRGMGWSGDSNYLGGTVNTNISLTFENIN